MLATINVHQNETSNCKNNDVNMTTHEGCSNNPVISSSSSRKRKRFVGFDLFEIVDRLSHLSPVPSEQLKLLRKQEIQAERFDLNTPTVVDHVSKEIKHMFAQYEAPTLSFMIQEITEAQNEQDDQTAHFIFQNSIGIGGSSSSHNGNGGNIILDQSQTTLQQQRNQNSLALATLYNNLAMARMGATISPQSSNTATTSTATPSSPLQPEIRFFSIPANLLPNLLQQIPSRMLPEVLSSSRSLSPQNNPQLARTPPAPSSPHSTGDSNHRI